MFLSRIFNWINDWGRKPTLRRYEGSTLKERWINALRSGDFEQTHNSLFVDKKGMPLGVDEINKANAFCCLGVLAAVDKPHYMVYPEEKVLEEMGVASDVLINMNDGLRYDFDQIANYIERSSNDCE